MGEGYVGGVKIEKVNSKQKIITARKLGGFNSSSKNFDESVTFCNILFYKDIINWESIKRLYVRDFIHRKLEMFDFSWKGNLEETETSTKIGG